MYYIRKKLVIFCSLDLAPAWLLLCGALSRGRGGRHLESQLNTPHLGYKARNQTVMFDADYLLQNGIERKTDQILLKSI